MQSIGYLDTDCPCKYKHLIKKKEKEVTGDDSICVKKCTDCRLFDFDSKL